MSKSKSLMMGKSDRRLLVGFFVAVIGLVALGFFLQTGIREIQNAANRRAEARKTAFKLKSLYALMADAETAQRGYLLTGDKKYLYPYEAATGKVDISLAELRADFDSTDEQATRLEEAAILVAKKIEIIKKTTALKDQGQDDVAVGIVKSGVGQNIMSQLRVTLNEMDEIQTLKIKERNAVMDEIVARSSKVMFGGSFLAVFLVGGLLFLLDRNQRGRARVGMSLRLANMDLERRQKQTERLIASQSEINTVAMDSNKVMEVVTRLALELTGADGAILEIAEDEMMLYNFTAGEAKAFLGARINRKGSLSGLALELGQILTCNEALTDDRVDREACLRVGIRSMICVPLAHEDKSFGVLKCYSKEPSHFDDQNSVSLALIAGQLSAALGRAQDFAEKITAILDLETAKTELMVSRDQAQSATHAKSRFLANMSHEIRTPLNGILGMTGLLIDGGLSQEQQDYGAAIKLSGESLLRLVNDVLDFSKVESGRMEFEKVNFDLVSTLQDVMKSFAYVAGQKNLDLILETDPKIPNFLSGDPGRVRQVLMNLIGNSIKFTPAGSVTVKSQYVAENSGVVELRVDIIDTGIGIKPEVLKNLFQEFVQGDASTTREYGGTGLGLSISKHLVEKMSGKIGAESVMGQGSKFSFTLKLLVGQRDEEAVEDSVEEPFPDHGRPWRILVGEDNQINQIIITKMLEKFGLRGDVAANGKEVVESLQNRPYDLLLLDCHMPVMDGYEATEVIRNSGTVVNAMIPIIAMTANAMTGDRERVLVAGMDDYLSKPLNRKTVRATVLKWLRAIQAEENKKNAA